MDKLQADAIAQAILQPDLKAQDEIRRKRAAEAQREADRRLAALFAIPGFAIGAVVAHYSGYRFTKGMIWGGVAGAMIGWVIVWLRRRQLAS